MRNAFLGALALLALTAPAAEASDQLAWHDCDSGFQCATAKVPLDYDRPHGRTISLALIRFPATDQAHRIGSVFIHPGGSGGAGVRFVRTAPPQALGLLGRRFDVIGVDTRGVGASRPAVDCDADPERLGGYPQPFPRPETLDAPGLIAGVRTYARRCFERSGELLGHMSSADMARDVDTLRGLVGDKQLTYIGNSYGSLVGATYASLFPGHARALALTAPVDADTWINRPFEAIREQTAAVEHGLHSGYGELALGALPVPAEDGFAGSFRNASGATPALVIGTTHDTFTPYAWAKRLVADLGNARLVTFRGDGHDVLTNFNPCVISTLLADLEDLTVPPAGKECS